MWQSTATPPVCAAPLEPPFARHDRTRTRSDLPAAGRRPRRADHRRRPTGTTGLGLYRSLWRFSAGARGALLIGAALLTGSQLLRLAVPWFVGQAVNALQRGGPHQVRAGRDLGRAACSRPAPPRGRCTARDACSSARSACACDARVSEALLDKLSAAPLRWHDRHAASDLQQRMGQASGALDGFTQNQYVVLQSVVTFVGTLGGAGAVLAG